MAGPGQARFYSSTFVQTSLASSIAAGTLQFNVGTTTGAPGTPFTVSVDQNTASEELMLVTNISGLQYTVTRGVGGTSAQSHDNGAPVVHVMYAQDLTDPSAHIGAFDDVHGLSVGSLVVGTTDTQTLTNKTLTSPVLNTPTINGATVTGTLNVGVLDATGSVMGTDFVASGLTGATSPSRYVGAVGGIGGPPTTGTFAVGDYTIDGIGGKVFVCTTAGSPGTFAQMVNETSIQTLNNKTLVSPVITGTATGSGNISLSGFLTGSDFVAIGRTGATAASTYAGGHAAGPPVTGTFSLGDFIVDQTGNIWVCISAGSPGTWQTVGGGQGIVAAPISSASLGTATSGTTDTIDSVLGNYVFTAIAGRRYKVIMTGLFGNATAVPGSWACRIRDSGSGSTPTTASAAVVDTMWNSIGTTAGGAGRMEIHMEDTFVASGSGTHTLAFFAQAVSGTNVFTPTSAANNNGTGSRKLWVEDIGAF
jgi:hypothetical protein